MLLRAELRASGKTDFAHILNSITDNPLHVVNVIFKVAGRRKRLCQTTYSAISSENCE